MITLEEWKEAGEEIKKDKLKKEEKKLERELLDSPKKISLQMRLALIKIELKKFEEANCILTPLMDLTEEEFGKNRLCKSLYFIVLSRYYKALNDLPNAKNAILNCNHLNSIELSIIPIVLKQFRILDLLDDAFMMVNKALEKDPTNAKLIVNKAQTFACAERMEDAIKTIEEALVVMPENSELITYYLYLNKNRVTEHFKTILESEPDNLIAKQYLKKRISKYSVEARVWFDDSELKILLCLLLVNWVFILFTHFLLQKFGGKLIFHWKDFTVKEFELYYLRNCVLTYLVPILVGLLMIFLCLIFGYLGDIITNIVLLTSRYRKYVMTSLDTFKTILFCFCVFAAIGTNFILNGYVENHFDVSLVVLSTALIFYRIDSPKMLLIKPHYSVWQYIFLTVCLVLCIKSRTIDHRYFHLLTFAYWLIYSIYLVLESRRKDKKMEWVS